jgi:glucokinase
VDVALAVDVGGTKLAAGLVGDDGSVLASESVPTLRGDDGEALFVHLRGLVESVLAAATGAGAVGGPWRPSVCGVGTGGPMTRGGAAVSPLNIPAWRGFPLRARLADVCGLPTFVDNDAKALALGEGWAGAARGRRDFLAMVVSTGVGGGLVLDGRLLDGAAGNAGHVGHVIVEPDGRPCACGARGCLEAEVSGTAIAAATGQRAEDAPAEWRARAGRLTGRAVASVANLLDLQLAVVAGSVALGYGDEFFAAAQAEVDRSSRLEFARGTVVRPAGLGATGPLVGAAAVGWRGLGRDIGIL